MQILHDGMRWTFYGTPPLPPNSNTLTLQFVIIRILRKLSFAIAVSNNWKSRTGDQITKKRER